MSFARERLGRIHPVFVYLCLLENILAATLISDCFDLSENVDLANGFLIVYLAGGYTVVTKLDFFFIRVDK